VPRQPGRLLRGGPHRLGRLIPSRERSSSDASGHDRARKQRERERVGCTVAKSEHAHTRRISSCSLGPRLVHGISACKHERQPRLHDTMATHLRHRGSVGWFLLFCGSDPQWRSDASRVTLKRAWGGV
jgi:hypothetical protein